MIKVISYVDTFSYSVFFLFDFILNKIPAIKGLSRRIKEEFPVCAFRALEQADSGVRERWGTTQHFFPVWEEVLGRDEVHM